MTALLACFAVPVAGALACFTLPRRVGVGAGLGLVAAAAFSVASLYLAWTVLQTGPIRYRLGGWGAPLGIELYVDGLGAFLLGMTGLVALPISIAAVSWFRNDPRGSAGYWPLWLMLLAAMSVAYLSADLFNLYVTLELVGLAAVALIVLTDKPEALTAAMRYLLASLLASLGYLIGVAILYAQYGVLDMYLLAGLVEPSLATWTAAALMSVGLLIKTAVFPLHFWLPPAHANAPAPVSAALSGLVVKVSLYLLMRLWFAVFEDLLSVGLGQLVGLMATAAIFGGSIQAILQRRLKMLIAYSTVAQLGYILMLVPLAIPAPGRGDGQWHFDAFAAGMYHALAHGLAKAAMFLAAGAVMMSLGSDRLRQLPGMAHTMPVATFAFGLAGVSLMGLPPSGGFVAKWFMINAALATGQWWWAVVFLLGGLLTAVYVFLVLRYAFLPPRPPAFRPVPRAIEYAALACALLSLGIGLRAVEPFALLELGTPFLEATHHAEGGP